MWLSKDWKDYELLDCGSGEKLERWGKYILVRPDPQAIWDTPRTLSGWNRPHARYARSSTGGGTCCSSCWVYSCLSCSIGRLPPLFPENISQGILSHSLLL